MSLPVTVSGFSKSYGEVQAVKELSMDVSPGELFGLIGPDGAGKTTTMRTLVTLLRADSGKISIGDYDAETHVREIRSIVGYMPQRFSLYPDLSIDQNLNFFADLFNVPKDEIPKRKERLYRFSRLEEFADRLAGRLSGGMKQKLALSCTLIHDPSVLVLDEPTTGVDPVSRNEFWNILAELKQQGVTIIVSTPYMDEALKCDRVSIMHNGAVLAAGKPDELTDLHEPQLFELITGDIVSTTHILSAEPDVISVQGFGDSVHIAVAPDISSDSLESTVSASLQREVTLKQITPTLEDVFIHLVNEGSRDDG